MIFDRTIDDVEKAKKIREEKVKKNISLSQEDIDILQKGFLTTEAINRIEQKQQELSDIFSNNGYYGSKTENKTWEYGDYFLDTDFERILNNNKILINAFFVFQTTPIDATNKIYFKNINKIEKLLYDLQTMIDDMISRYRICGTFNCGG